MCKSYIFTTTTTFDGVLFVYDMHVYCGCGCGCGYNIFAASGLLIFVSKGNVQKLFAF